MESLTKSPKPIKVDKNKLYTVKGYAKLIGKSRQTIYNWLEDEEKSKEFNVVYIGDKMFIHL